MSLRKDQRSTKTTVMEDLRDRQLYGRENNTTTSISPSLPLATILNVKWMKLSKQKAERNKMDTKHDSTLYYLQETPFRSKDTKRLKVKGWKKDIPCKFPPEREQNDNPNIRPKRLHVKTVTRHAEGQETPGQEPTHPRSHKSLSTYIHQTSKDPEYVTETFIKMKGETDSCIGIAGDLDQALMVRTTTQVSVELHIVNQTDLTETERTLPNNRRLWSFLKCAQKPHQDGSYVRLQNTS